MKYYSQFINEAYASRENIQEALPLIPIGIGAAKLASAGLSAYYAYQAAQKLRKGDYKGAAVDALGFVPVGGPAFKGARALGANKWLARGASTLASAGKWTGLSAADPGPAAAQTTTPTKTQTKPAPTPTATPTTTRTPAPQTPSPSSVVLARKKGVMGKLDKSTGKFTSGDWTKQESDRYKRVAAARSNP